jgi:hypothetical protein
MKVQGGADLTNLIDLTFGFEKYSNLEIPSCRKIDF